MAERITKKRYTSHLETLTRQLAALQAERDYLTEQLEGDPVETAIEEVAEVLNALHDSIYDMQQEIKDWEGDYRRRDWTWQDYAEQSLVASNID